MKPTKRRFVQVFLLLVLPTVVVVVALLMLMRWHIPTQIRAKLTAEGAAFTIDETLSGQILTSVEFQKIYITNFSNIELKEDISNPSREMMMSPFDPVAIEGKPDKFTPPSVLFEPASLEQNLLGTLEPFEINAEDRIILQIREKKINKLTVIIENQKTISLRLMINELFRLTATLCKRPPIFPCPRDRDACTYQAKHPNIISLIKFTQPTTLSLFLTIPGKGVANVFSSDPIPVAKINFKPYLIKHIEIEYPNIEKKILFKASDDKEKKISEISDIVLKKLGNLSIKKMTFNAELQGIDFEIEGIVGYMRIDSYHVAIPGLTSLFMSVTT